MTLADRYILADLSPHQIVCLTEETVETLYLLGQQDRIVGVTGYAIRPPRVRREKPRVGAFTSADIPKILALKPDLVLTFSDLQADIVAQLIRAGVAVHAFNQRNIAGVLSMIQTLGAITGTSDRAAALIDLYCARIAALRLHAPSIRPRIYFEEWDEPMISGIRWVSELIEIAGGVDVFDQMSHAPAARDRIVTSAQVITAAPDIIIGSWCGKKLQPAKIAARAGWHDVPAVRNGHIYEIKSPLILQPGPAALDDGLDAICAILEKFEKGSA